VKAVGPSVPVSLPRSWSEKMRDIILFQCTECKNKNYSTMKNKKNTTEKLQRKKFCRHCRKHVLHKETKS
jgi:large subunit ribosomal protein L33